MAFFDGTDDHLYNASPGLAAGGYPLTFGCWFNPTANGGMIFGYTDTGVADPGSRFAANLSTGGAVQIVARASGPPQNILPTTNTVTLGAWHYGVWRWISATNRRVSVLFPSGLIEHAAISTSITASSLDMVSLGNYRHSGGAAATYHTGHIAQAWWADADIQEDGAALSDFTLRQLASGGPFSIPHFRKSIVEYHSLRSSLPSVMNNREEHYWRNGKPAWTNSGGTGLGIHPPLPARFEPPHGRSSLVIV